MATAQKKTVKTIEKSFPSVSVGLSKAWDVTKDTWLRQLGIGLLSGVVAFFVTLISVILFAIVNIGNIPAITQMIETNSFKPELLSGSFWIFSGLIAILWVIALTLSTMVFQVSLMKLLNFSYDKKSVKFNDIFSSSFGAILPLIGVSIVSSLLVSGGLFLFIIPGIVISMFLSFATWEVVLWKKSVFQALSESYKTVRSEFWSIFGRSLLLGFIIMMFSMATSVFSEAVKDSNSASFFVSLVSFVVQTGSQYFAAAYALVIYRQAKEMTKNQPSKSLRGLVIVSVMGWVIGLLLWGSVTAFAIKAIKEVAQNYRDQVETQEQNRLYFNELDTATDATDSSGLRKITR